jgi:hypothetical protein
MVTDGTPLDDQKFLLIAGTNSGTGSAAVQFRKLPLNLRPQPNNALKSRGGDTSGKNR